MKPELEKFAVEFKSLKGPGSVVARINSNVLSSFNGCAGVNMPSAFPTIYYMDAPQTKPHVIQGAMGADALAQRLKQLEAR